ncbi:MAG: type VI secretion system contractile sheath large subunit [Planctomycetia bacterium]
MSTERSAEQSSNASKTFSLLDQLTAATPAPRRDEVSDLISNLIANVLQGVVKWDKSVAKTVRAAIAQIDQQLSVQLAEIMHQEQFQKLEGSWRGLQHLVMKTTTSARLKLRVLNVSKRELFKDLDKAVEFDQSVLFRKLYEEEFGTPGGEPYGALVGDYEFTSHPEDIDLLEKVSGVCAAAHCPFISAAAPELFGLESWSELSKPRDIEKVFMAKKYAKWNSFRDSEDSRFVSLVLPRVLARLPYGAATKTVEEFSYEEFPTAGAVDHDRYCWMNASFVMAANMTQAFHDTGWCTAIRGVENGGKVEGLPVHNFISDDGDVEAKCPTEVPIYDRREKEISDAGFLPLCHFKNTDYSVFFGADTCQRPKKYDRPDATANARISARLPYLMASSRIAHFLKCIVRDKIGGFNEREDMEGFLRRWIADYVLSDDKPSADMKAKYPLKEAEIRVEEIPGKPGSYNAVALLRPWLQLEELTTSLRLVAQLPKSG